MNTDMAPARPASRDVGALLRHADEHARAAMAMPHMVRQRLAPDDRQVLREDDLSLVGGFADAIARQLLTTLGLEADAAQPARVVQNVVLPSAPVTRLLYARAIEARLCRNAPLIGLAMPELPPRVEAQAADAQDELAESAMALIIAQGRFIGSAQGFHLDLSELPPEHVSMLVNRALVWAQDQGLGNPLTLRRAADDALATFDERTGRPHRLMRFCHLFALPHAGDSWSLAENGPSLLFAMLAKASALPADYVIDLVRDADLARLCIALRACDIPPGTAARLLEGIALLASLRLDDVATAATFAAIAPDDAAQMIAGWRNLLGADIAGAIW